MVQKLAQLRASFFNFWGYYLQLVFVFECFGAFGSFSWSCCLFSFFSFLFAVSLDLLFVAEAKFNCSTNKVEVFAYNAFKVTLVAPVKVL